jgi:Transposase
MDVVVERCAGLDVHKDTVVACVGTPETGGSREQTTRTFKAMTIDLMGLRDWLVAMGVTLVGMESTGVYWKPVFYVLEDEIECWLLNARKLRNVPGRKTDVQDAEWICQLVEHGLVRPSFVPPKPIRPGAPRSASSILRWRPPSPSRQPWRPDTLRTTTPDNPDPAVTDERQSHTVGLTVGLTGFEPATT